MNRHHDGRGLNDRLRIEASEDRHSFKIVVQPVLGDGPSPETVALVADINFQNGGRAEVGVNGVTTEAVLTCIELYLEHVNKQFPSRETALVLTKIQEARLWASERARDRASRGVLGRQEK